MKILIVSGFLGAGKTTFIKALAKRTGKEFAILENEYGSVGIDGDVLKSEVPNEQVNIWEVTEGCICCSMKGDFASSVLTIANTVNPEYLVVEPTGVAKLSQVVENLQQIEYERIQLLAPITVVDGQSYRRYALEYPQLYKDQVKTANTVIVSKVEHLGTQEREWLNDELKNINPDGEILMDVYATLEQSQWDSLLNYDYHGKVLESSPLESSANLPDTFTLQGVTLESPERLFVLLESLIRGHYGNVFRAKGQVSTENQTFRFDVADGKYSITEGTPNGDHDVVFIGTGILRQRLRNSFEMPNVVQRGSIYSRSRRTSVIPINFPMYAT
jgi:G3E family GTPase